MIVYTATGGIPAVTWTDVMQMTIIFAGLITALIIVVSQLPTGISLLDATYLAGAAGRLNVVDTHFDWNNRYNLWSGLIGGCFLALAYFGCDQSQVQRYLTGKSIAQSKLSLLLNAVAKVPIQFFILFLGAMVFVFYVFERPPLIFQKTTMAAIETLPAYAGINQKYERAFTERRDSAFEFTRARRGGDEAARLSQLARYRASQKEIEDARRQGTQLFETSQGVKGASDTNYIFLSFVTRYLPAGVVGLVIAVIFSAAMSATSGEINALATVTLVDIYQRHIKPNASDRHYLKVSRLATVFWGCYAIVFAQYGRGLGSLIEAVNMVGSLFYGSLLGVFVLAFFVPRAGGTAAFVAMLTGEAAIFAAFFFTQISFLWYNVIGAVVVVATGIAIGGRRL